MRSPCCYAGGRAGREVMDSGVFYVGTSPEPLSCRHKKPKYYPYSPFYQDVGLSRSSSPSLTGRRRYDRPRLSAKGYGFRPFPSSYDREPTSVDKPSLPPADTAQKDNDIVHFDW